MSLIPSSNKQNSWQLRQWACIGAVALPAIGWLWGGGPTMIAVLAVVGAVLAVRGWLAPSVASPFYLVLWPPVSRIGMVLGEIAMLAIYFGVVVPLGFVFRATQGDPLQLRLDRMRKSYWQPKNKPTRMASYYRQS